MAKILHKKRIKINPKHLIKKLQRILYPPHTRLYLIVGVNLLIILGLVLYFQHSLRQERFIMTKAIENMQQQSGVESASSVSPLTLQELKKSGIERYFLSKVDLVGNYYTPLVHLCLFDNGKPIYSQYVYETWALVNYPNTGIPKISLVRYLLLPQDNSNFQPDEKCFIKEIKTEQDWKDIQTKYGFTKNQFMK